MKHWLSTTDGKALKSICTVSDLTKCYVSSQVRMFIHCRKAATSACCSKMVSFPFVFLASQAVCYISASFNVIVPTCQSSTVVAVHCLRMLALPGRFGEVTRLWEVTDYEKFLVSVTCEQCCSRKTCCWPKAALLVILLVGYCSTMWT